MEWLLYGIKEIVTVCTCTCTCVYTCTEMFCEDYIINDDDEIIVDGSK